MQDVILHKNAAKFLYKVTKIIFVQNGEFWEKSWQNFVQFFY